MVSAVAGSAPMVRSYVFPTFCCLLRYEVVVKLRSVNTIRNKKLNLAELA